MKRTSLVACYALGTGLSVTMLAFIIGTAVGVGTNQSVTVPGVLSFQQSATGLELSTSASLPVFALAASILVGLPLGILLTRGARAR